MRNVIIGLVVAFIIVGGVWFLSGSASQRTENHGHMSESYHGAVKSGQEVVECPVMGTKFPAGKAYGKTEYNGKMYYFCCAGCPGEFKKNPEKYAK